MSFDREQLKSYLPGLALTVFGVTAVTILSRVLDLDGTWTLGLIVLALLVWPLALLIDRVIKKGGQPSAPITTEASPSAPRKTNQSFPDLEQASALAIGWLREKLSGKESSGAKASSGKGWFGAKLSGDGDALYQRPWFVIAGPRNSGKTSLLLSAGLNFHALQGQIRTEQNLLRPTTACEWRITDNLVLLDTAGRYQDERFQRDHDEWLGFIDLIKRHRRRRPLDGMLLVVNAAEVVNAERQTIEQQANILRDRLDELILQTRSRFPVYLVFTHADKIAGFAEFFRNCDQSERAQVWGASFKASESRNQLGKLDEEFNQLYDNLLRRRLVRLGIPDQAAEQSRVFDFPFRFRDERRKFFWFISMLFQTRPHNKEQQPLLRGFYFTSSPVVASGDGQRVGQSYFTANLFRTLLAGDRHLAAHLQPGKWMDQYARPVLLGLAAFLLLFLTAGLLISFSKNREAIRRGRELGQAVLEAEKSKDDAKVWAELDKLRVFLKDQEENTGLSQHFGLHVGEDLHQPLRAIYFEAISQRVFNQAANELEKDLREFTDNPKQLCPDAPLSEKGIKCNGDYYKLLRAYRMLSLSEPVNSTLLVEALEPYWKKFAPTTELGVALNQLRFYADQADRDTSPHWQTNAETARKAQAYLRENYPVHNRYLDAITTKTDVASTDLETFGSVFKSSWVVSNSPAVLGSFTLKGYEQLRDRLISVSKAVVEKEGLAAKDESIDPGKVQKLYAEEYLRQWEKFLDAVDVRPLTGKKEAPREALSELAADGSPLATLLRKVAEQTSVSAPVPNGWWEKIFGPPTPPALPKEVIDKFKPLALFVAGTTDKDLPGYLKVLDTLRKDVEQLGGKGQPLTLEGVKFDEAQSKVNEIKKPLQTGPTRAAADLLQKPLTKLKELIVGIDVVNNEEAWKNLFARLNNLSKAYPFFSNIEQPAGIDELKLLFKPGDGDLARFADKVFDQSPQGWTRKSGDTSFSPELVEYFNRLRPISDALFNKGPDLNVGCTLNIRPPASGTQVVIEVGNNKAESASTGSAIISWPQGGAGAKIKVTANGEVKERYFRGGQWALFRLVEEGGAVRSGNRYNLSWTVQDVVVQATLDLSNPNSPFSREIFTRLGAAPKN